MSRMNTNNNNSRLPSPIQRQFILPYPTTTFLSTQTNSAASPGRMSWVHAALSKRGERPGASPERVVAAVAGMGRLSGNWWPGLTVGWTMLR